MTDPITQLLGQWSADLNIYSVAFRIAVSVILSAIIGCERSRKRHSAGLRTFVLVSLFGTAAIILDLYLGTAFGGTLPVITAASVIAAAMIGGNSVLFSSRNRIKGLTTSAALWLCCLLGVCAGAGLYTITLIVFAALLGSLSLLIRVEARLQERSSYFEIHLELKNRGDLQAFITTVRKLGAHIENIEANPAYLTSGMSVYTVSFTIEKKKLSAVKKHSDLISALQALECVSYIDDLH